MVAILLAAFGARSGTGVHFTCYFLSSWSTGQLFRAFHWHLFRLPAFGRIWILTYGPNFVSVCVIRFSFGAFLDFDGSFEPYELTTTIFPRFEPFSLVQYCCEIGIFRSPDTFSSRRDTFHLHLDLFRASSFSRIIWTALSSFYRLGIG